MSTQEITLLIGAIAGLLTILGGGVKWILVQVDARANITRLAEAELRAELSQRVHAEVQMLRQEMDTMRREKSLYMRRIYQLERFIHEQPNISIPIMEGWPPNV